MSWLGITGWTLFYLLAAVWWLYCIRCIWVMTRIRKEYDKALTTDISLSILWACRNRAESLEQNLHLGAFKHLACWSAEELIRRDGKLRYKPHLASANNLLTGGRVDWEKAKQIPDSDWYITELPPSLQEKIKAQRAKYH